MDSDPHLRGEVQVLCSSLSLPQWLHTSRANVRGLAVNHEALCILAPALTPLPAFSSSGLLPSHPCACLLPSNTPGSYLVPTYPKLPESSLHPGISMAPCSFLWDSLNRLARLKPLPTGVCPHSLSPRAPDSHHCRKPGYRPECLSVCLLSLMLASRLWPCAQQVSAL